ncbi:MAG TPA: tol-pal system protein YbgF [Alphaproteobacteria bacterium]|nr:tol-pal system protein YbgF [Alphaproteobacteria bacterium]
MNKKKTLLNLRGAQGVKVLCLSSMTVLLSVCGSGIAIAQSPVYTTNNPNAQMEVRLQQMEAQVRDLTGRVENQVYEINQLKQQIKQLEMGAPGTSAGFDNGPKTNELPRVAPPPGAGQIGVPTRDMPGQSVMAKPEQSNPFNLDLKPQEIEGMKTAVPGGGTTEATALYEQAYANLKVEKYEEAEKEFEKFLTNYGDHVLAANAKYWLGETYYVRGDYKKAARTFAEGFKTYPESAKSPDILLKLGMSLNGMGKKKEACVALSQVSVKFPTGSEPVVERAEKEMEKLGCDS